MLPLLYLDKLLDEIQLRFRDRFEAELKDNSTYFPTMTDGRKNVYSSFDSEFRKTMTAVESRYALTTY